MANSLDAFVPEMWANESVLILEENMVAAALVHRNFEDQLQSFGDVVNTRQPAEFTALRKVDTDDVTDQDASATNIQVPLNQFVHVTYIIKDGEESKSFKNLVNEYMRPAAQAMARFVDQVILGQVYRFMANRAGTLGGMTSSNAQSYILDTREVMNRNKAYMANRNFILTPNAETEMLKTSLFISAEQVGDNGTALREASIGRKLGFDFFMCQNASEVATGSTIDITMLVNNGSGELTGDTVITVDGITGAVNTGDWVTFAGDATPHIITAHTETLGNTTQITISPALAADVANNAVITRYVPGAVNLGAGYAAGWSKPIVVDGFTVAPKVGQLVNFGTDVTNYYSVIAGTTTSITLDRPLVAALADNDTVHLGPAGSYNFAFHRNALAFVSRPLATPMAGTGALSARASYKNVGMRTTITYDGKAQGHRVTHDLLCGIAVLDTDLGAVMFA